MGHDARTHSQNPFIYLLFVCYLKTIVLPLTHFLDIKN